MCVSSKSRAIKKQNDSFEVDLFALITTLGFISVSMQAEQKSRSKPRGTGKRLHIAESVSGFIYTMVVFECVCRCLCMCLWSTESK